MSHSPRVCVVGAGISGLTSALRLQQGGFDVTVLEGEATVGGRMSSVERDGFIMNRGAQLITPGYSHIVDLYRELGLLENVETIDSVIGIIRAGIIHRFRSSHFLWDGVTTKLISWRSKLRLLRLLPVVWRLRPALRNADFALAAPFDKETAIDFADRRLDGDIKQYLIEPVVRGISREASLVDFLFTASKTMGSGLIQYKGGIGALPQCIARRLGVTLGAEVTSVTAQDRSAEVCWFQNGREYRQQFDACVVAVPGPIAANVVKGLPERARFLLNEKLLYSRLTVVHFGLGLRPQETAGFVFPADNAVSGLVSVSFEHNMRTDAAPDGKGLLTALFTDEWSKAHEHCSDEQIRHLTEKAVSQVCPELSNNVELFRFDRWRYAAQSARPGYCSAVTELLTLLDPGFRVQFAGDYFGSSSTNACVRAATRAVGNIRTQVTAA